MNDRTRTDVEVPAWIDSSILPDIEEMRSRVADFITRIEEARAGLLPLRDDAIALMAELNTKSSEIGGPWSKWIASMIGPHDCSSQDITEAGWQMYMTVTGGWGLRGALDSLAEALDPEALDANADETTPEVAQ